MSAQQLREGPLTNAAVVKLVRAGFKEKTIIAIIRSRASRFNLDSDRLIELKQNGVSENIILAMLAQDESFILADDEWTDDPTFKGNVRPKEGEGQKQPGASDVFGSGQSSRGQTSGRGMNGANQGETTTTGSATVRILRPTVEAGGASLKLEKTPTLDNESVIRLVEAGFSEGTIIKRIEDSPADFDLSSAKLAELRRRRVTDAIIAAMTLAMRDESSPKQVEPARAKGN
ncbi:MAG: hypothetical protein ABR501_08500 [Pyrinomonadaceae bacterium]